MVLLLLSKILPSIIATLSTLSNSIYSFYFFLDLIFFLLVFLLAYFGDKSLQNFLGKRWDKINFKITWELTFINYVSHVKYLHVLT